MSTDWRALCAELADALDHNRQCLLDDRSLTHPLADKARAALAELEPEVMGPTDEELLELWQDWSLGWDPQKGMVLMPHFAEYARAVLARWGNRQGSLDSSPASPAEGEQRHPAPVPVAERLPGPEDLNDKGECWEWDPASDAWVLIRPIGLTFRTGPWLPATALPLPATEAQP